MYFLDSVSLTDFDCTEVQPFFNVAKFVIRLIQIAVPLSLDFFKALIAGDEKEMKMKRKPFISRLVAAIVILVLPWLVELIAGQVAGSEKSDSFWTCYHNSTPVIDFSNVVKDSTNKMEQY